MWVASQFLVPDPPPSPHPLFAAGPVSTAATEPPKMPLTISFFLPCLRPPPPLSLPTSVPLWGFQHCGAGSSSSFLPLFRASQSGRHQLLPFFLPLIGSFFLGDSKQTQTSPSLGPPLNPNMFAFLHKSHHIPGVRANLQSALQYALLASPLLLFLFLPIIIAKGETKPSLYSPSKNNMGEML